MSTPYCIFHFLLILSPALPLPLSFPTSTHTETQLHTHTSTHISYKIYPDCSLPSTKYKLGNLPGFVTKGTYFFKEVRMERWRKWCLSTKNPRATWGSCFLSLSWAFLNIWQLNGRTSGNYLGLDGGWEGWPSNAAKSLASRVRNNCSPKFFHSSKAHREHNWLRELRHEKLNPREV